MDAKFLTAGKAIFTVTAADGTHNTFRIVHKPANGRYSEAYFVSLLTGPNNEDDYSYLGMMDPNTFGVRLTAKSCQSEQSLVVRTLRRVLARIKAGEYAEIEKAGWSVKHAGFCCRCGRLLTTPESVETGVGPECSERLGWGRPARRTKKTTPRFQMPKSAALVHPDTQVLIKHFADYRDEYTEMEHEMEQSYDPRLDDEVKSYLASLTYLS